ncbi:glycosyltransferase [Asticcacaulis sp. BYS171W]|uniref:Glycosyltransferase n=1 Tax=Asticcacaulis aquaticus TaxID=2984212 RepID=A0ABT5HZC9_9CAUL|nr:glycosyltransferase [Asticcacaulis aquaticus]MDC7685298.1 glycosyltransferase [Asticcacaulis aquaticus]
MLGLRTLPLKYRLPLIHGGLEAIALTRMGAWPKTDDLSPGRLLVSGFLTESLGIGRAGRMTADALEAAGYAVERHDMRPAFKHIIDQKAVLPGENGGVWLIHANAPEVLVMLMAHDPSQWSRRYRIGYWAWETPKAPAQWARMAKWLHEIWVPSTFVRDALIVAFEAQGQTGLSERVRVMPHPLLSGAAPDRARFGLQDHRCEALSLFDIKSSPARKNPWAAIEAWLAAFPEPTDKAALTLKVSGIDAATEMHLTNLIGGRDDIRLYTERLSDADMDRFMVSFDILLSLHRSEGFGLSLLEAMAAGVAVVATDWSGNTDFLKADNGYPVPYDLIPLNDPDGAYSAVKRERAQYWAEPDVQAAAHLLRELVYDPGIHTEKARVARLTPAVLNRAWAREALDDMPFNAWLS